MKETLIQHRIISIPQTSGAPKTYQTIIKADDCYNFLTGIAATIGATVPVADSIMIEFRDDYESILSFSPSTNWLKNTTSPSFNLQDVFKPLNVDAKGRNFYLNVRVTNCNAFSFTLLLKQSINENTIVDYDEQSWEFSTPALGQGLNLTLPDNYNFCKGIMIAGGDVTTENEIGLDIYDSAGSIVDAVPVSVLRQTYNTPYDNGFFPVNFDSKNRQIFVRLTELGTTTQQYTPTNLVVTFLLVNNA
jgi:hypothetical protein